MGKFKDSPIKKDSKAPPADTDLSEEEKFEQTNEDLANFAAPPSEPEAPAEAPLVVDGIAQDPEPAVDAPPEQKMNRRYRVVGGPSSVMYNGQRINVTPGKVFVEHSVDLEHLRSQGIQLQLIAEVTSVMGGS
jgi:hypothetical protein